MLLRLDYKKRRKEFKLRPFGEYEELTDFIVPERGDEMIAHNASFEEPTRKPLDKYKVLNIASLYGSTKPFGLLKEEEKPRKNGRHYEKRDGVKVRRPSPITESV